MNLVLNRTARKPDGIFGQLCDEKHVLILHTLEHSYEGKTFTWEPKIPAGTFKCVRGQHQLVGMAEPFETFEITRVEGHTNLLFHCGNFNKDSEGCVLLGTNMVNIRAGDDMIIDSKKAFGVFMGLQKGVDEFTLTVL